MTGDQVFELCSNLPSHFSEELPNGEKLKGSIDVNVIEDSKFTFFAGLLLDETRGNGKYPLAVAFTSNSGIAIYQDSFVSVSHFKGVNNAVYRVS
ncbi:hypothetical protein BCT46_25280 [Vibrio sp. 10N.261.46.E8]|nr:hypothetical protein BH584_21380 [Vibrio sp. 10N.261.45.E1]PMJ34656.1 hypothetical protein BCU27_24590 [Vibrio sp. 10N.286.45.B6]PMM75866.1 hypothetical protein BCT48_25305 [Vibrio sp. 10N.261.46.F12]PMM89067.1 hypothetical protein BCT46_25280 [Vibrio sp. 10N.261.46.E8]PMN40326.1 hypothetical protein BCT34_23435 [Vibrio sp. 10N.261.45.E2]PMN59946.1 hypothetical protein BCT32_21115 [Vibrio sp. 10N.261.45.E11]PMN76740.1 hypothetical protein BCT22_22505 [Vibrio sp. 10N.261.45.A1]PMN88594.1 h